nr:MAG TPA: hypothetical protein [Caudoviricetes sp.]
MNDTATQCKRIIDYIRANGPELRGNDSGNRKGDYERYSDTMQADY